jgi:hypothetical protein
MRKSKSTENTIITILKAVEGGRAVRDVCREHEVQRSDLLQVDDQVRREPPLDPVRDAP